MTIEAISTASQYGNLVQEPRGGSNCHIEEFTILGYTVLREILTPAEVTHLRESLLVENQRLCQKYGDKMLEQIGERDIVRCPLLSNDRCFDLVFKPVVIDLVTTILGAHFVLHLQNALINQPSRVHHQTAWHRDLPYQNYTVSSPLGCSLLVCLNDFTKENGATKVLPYSHKLLNMPSEAYVEAHEVQVEMNLGDAVLFDVMLMHRAGINHTTSERVAVNTVYTRPIIKQQIDLPRAFGDARELTQLEKQVLGYSYRTPASDAEYKQRKVEKRINEDSI